jgi:hypothetical protein
MTALPQRIEALVAGARPVRALSAPQHRALLWLGFSALVMGAFVFLQHGVEPETYTRLSDPGFVLPAIGSLLAGALASLAAFNVSLPDRPLAWLILPAPAALLWVSSIGVGCLVNWVDLPADAEQRAHALDCFQAVTLVSLPLLASLLFMLRHGFVVRPVVVALSASLAVAALGSSILMFIHPQGTSLMILGWNLGMVGIALLLGRVLVPIIRRLGRIRIA